MTKPNLTTEAPPLSIDLLIRHVATSWQATKRTGWEYVQHAIKAGHYLQAIKAAVPHGEFMKALKNSERVMNLELPGQDMCNKLMKIAKHEDLITEVKPISIREALEIVKRIKRKPDIEKPATSDTINDDTDITEETINSSQVEVEALKAERLLLKRRLKEASEQCTSLRLKIAELEEKAKANPDPAIIYNFLQKFIQCAHPDRPLDDAKVRALVNPAIELKRKYKQ